MNSADERTARQLPSDWLLLALIFAIPLMKPAVAGEVIAADLLFVALAAAVALETALGRRRLTWIGGYGPLLAYVCGLTPSLLATSNFGTSLFKLATEFYLIGLAAIPAWLIDSEMRLQRAVLAWLAASALVCLVAFLGLLAFVTARGSWLLGYSSFGYGSLPPGNYPRLSLTFFNANMACNYLTVSLALTLIAERRAYLDRTICRLLIAAMAIACASTISPGLGGIALLAGTWLWLSRRAHSPRLACAALLLGVGVAGFFLFALALTPFGHATAPFVIRLPFGLVVYPAPRLLTWSAATLQFLRHPLIGIGIGVDPVHVDYANPSGFEVLTDAHNIFLSIAAQCGLIGLAGLAAIIVFVMMRTPWKAALRGEQLPPFLLGAALLDVLVYQGLGGSFEDTRHIWLLLGLFLAAARLGLKLPGGNNRKAGAPSPC